MTTTEFLDAVKVKRGLASDYKLAKFLGVSQQTISSYRTGRSMMDEAMCLKIAAALELEPGEVLVAIAIEREKRVEVKTAWQRVAKRLAAGVGVALLYITLSAGQSPAYAQDATKLYICDKRWKQAALRLSRWLWTLGLALALAAPAAAADWSGADTARQAAFLALGVADWGQTLSIARHPESMGETNPLLGRHPSVAEVNRYFALALTAHSAIAQALPRPYREAWQYVWIGLEGRAVRNNWRAGLRVEF